MFADNSSAGSGGRVPDIFELFQLLKQHKILLAKLMAAFMTIGLIIVWLMPSQYRAYATLVLNEQNLNMNDFQNIMGGLGMDGMSVNTEARILGSASLAEKTIKASKLTAQPEYDSAENDREAVYKFLSNLDINTQNNSRAIEIAFTSKDPELAATVANTHAQTYMDTQVANKQQQVEKLSKWFEVKVKDLKADAIRKNQAVQDYRAKENLVVGKDNKELIYQQISDVAGQLVPVEVSKFGYEANAQGSAGQQGDAMVDVVNSPLIQKLKADAAAAARELGAMRAKYGPNHPKVIEVSGQVNQMNRAIDNEIHHIVDSMGHGRESSEAQETLLKTRLAGLNAEANDMREKMITLESLQVEAEASKKILDNFLKNYETIQSQVSFAWPDATLVSPAIVPTKPIAPGKKLMALLVLVFSACLSLGIVFAIELTRRGLKNFSDIRRLSQKPLGIIPLTGNPLIAIRNVLQSSYKEAIKRIYMAGLMDNPARCILVTSAMPKEGRTSFTLSMAYYIRSLGHSVLVVDADFLRPGLSYLTGSPEGPGLADVLSGKMRLADALDVKDDGISVLSAGSKELYSPDLLKSGQIEQLMNQCKKEYDYVLIDAGPMLAHSESAIVAAQVDGILVIAEWLKTSEKNLNNLFAMLRPIKTPVLGVVMNKVDIDKYKAMTNGADFLLPKAANAA